MGGGNLYAGVYGLSSKETPEFIEFEIIIRIGDESRVWNLCSIDDSVKIVPSTVSSPALEVFLKGIDNIGLVPPTYIGIILQSIRNGKTPFGTIIDKKGTKESPRITVRMYL